MVVVLKLEKLTEFDTQALTTDIEAVAPKCSWKLALDMTNVALVTSAGLGWLIQIRKRAETQQANGSKGKVVLFGLSPELLGLLKATKLLTLLPHAKDRSAAIAMFAG
jgi:anti-anti-sigma factor